MIHDRYSTGSNETGSTEFVIISIKTLLNTGKISLKLLVAGQFSHIEHYARITYYIKQKKLNSNSRELHGIVFIVSEKHYLDII